MKRLQLLFNYLRPYRSLLVAKLIASALMALFTVVSIPAIIPFLQILFDSAPSFDPSVAPPTFQLSFSGIENSFKYYFASYIYHNGKEKALLYVCLLIVVIFFLKNLFSYLSAVFMTPIRNGIIRDIRQELNSKYLHLPLDFYAEEKKGDLLSRLSTDVHEVEVSILNMLDTLIKAPLIMVGSLALMIYFSGELMLFVVILLLFTVIVIGGLGKKLKKVSGAVQLQLGALVSHIEESLAGLKIIKGLGAEQYRENHFNEINEKYKNTLNRLWWRKDLASPLSEFLGISVVTALLWFGAKSVFNQSLSAETFFAFLYAFFNIIEPSKSISSAWFNIQKGMAAAERIQYVLSIPNDESLNEEGKTLEKFQSQISFENVSFQYPNTSTLVLDEISFTLAKGKVMALVGTSGGGKTTLVDLLVGFYKPSQGVIKIDGINLDELNLQSLREKMAIVTQEPILFHDTIYNNIVFGTPNVSRAQVEAAAKIANAHDFITASAKGYQTVIGDRGSKLSGGQRQRLTIARAVLRNPEILILDEATSALDAESEQLVQAALQQLLKNRTAIIIAHRLSTIQNADWILVLEKGKIVEQGTHQQLIQQQGSYQSFVALQNLGEKN